jgi:hypothetical protein
MQFDLSTAIYARVPLSAFGRREIDPEPARGRPRKSSFRQDMEIALCIGEARRALAGIGRSTAHPKLAGVLKQIGHLRRRNALDWRIPALSRKADALGRYYQTPILPPEKSKPDIDKIVAKKLGVKPRKVRAIRSDPRFEPFIGPEPWAPSDWEAEVAKRALLRRRAAALLTPERLAKVEIGERFVDGAYRLEVVDPIDRIIDRLTPSQAEAARNFCRRCLHGGLTHRVLYFRGAPREFVDELGGRVLGGGELQPFAHPYRNLLIDKIMATDERDGNRFIDFNRGIVARIGVRGLWFLRTVLYEGRSPEEFGLPATPEKVLALLGRLLDRAFSGSPALRRHKPFGRWSTPIIEEVPRFRGTPRPRKAESHKGLGAWWEVAGKSAGYAEILRAQSRPEREAEARQATRFGKHWVNL